MRAMFSAEHDFPTGTAQGTTPPRLAPGQAVSKEPFRIGTEDMVCPATDLEAAVRDFEFDARLESARNSCVANHASADRDTFIGFRIERYDYSRRGSKFPSRVRPRSSHARRRAPASDTCVPSASAHIHSSFHPTLNAPWFGSRHPLRFLAGTFAARGRAQGAPKRVSHAKQNAHRCFPPGRNPGGRSSW